MNSKIIWSIIVFFSIILTCIALLFLRKENPGYKDDKMKEDAKSSKTIEKTTESSLRKNFDDESTIIQKPQEESSQRIEDIEQSNLDEESTPKVNTPSTQKTLSRQSLLTHDRKRSLAYNEAEQYKSVVFNRAFPSLYKKLDEQES